MTTGYNIHEGSDELARRRMQNRVDDETRMMAASYARLERQGLITRRFRISMLARRALAIMGTPRETKPW